MHRRLLHIDVAKVLASHLIVLHHFTVYGPLADALDLALPRVTDWFFEYARRFVRLILPLGAALLLTMACSAVARAWVQAEFVPTAPSGWLPRLRWPRCFTSIAIPKGMCGRSTSLAPMRWVPSPGGRGTRARLAGCCLPW